MKTRIVRIGNSRGVRIPKPLLEQAKLTGEVELVLEDNRILISAADHPRSGWAEAFARMRARGDDILLEGDRRASTRFDESQWEWR